LIWSEAYDGGFPDDEGGDVSVDAQGNVYVSGWVWNASHNRDASVIKYAQTGDNVTRSWVNIFDGGGDDVGGLAAVDPWGNIISCGRSAGGSGTPGDFLVIKYDGAGNKLWSARYGDVTSDENPTDLCLDSSGNLYVTGLSGKDPADKRLTDYLTIKYDGATGSQVWAVTYDGDNHQLDAAGAVAVDSAGDVYVTGKSGETSSGRFGRNYATVKYEGDSGIQLWAAVYDCNGVFDDDEARDIVVDPHGDVYVTGRSIGADRNYDFATVKYRSSDGAALWERRYDDHNGDDEGRRIALDPAGNVVAAGISDEEYVVVKYVQDFSSDLIITTQTLPGGIVGAGYKTVLEAFGGSGNRTWSVAGFWPPGLNLEASSGMISGILTAAGTYHFTAQVIDGPLFDTQDLRVVIVGGLPARLGFARQPADTSPGKIISPPVTVEIRDAGGNLIPTATNPVTISIQTNPGGGVLSGTLTKSAVDGLAAFDDLSIDAPGTGYTLKAESGSMLEATSLSFNVLLPAIVFESSRNGNEEIYVMNADGTGQTNLTRNAADDRRPAWSPGWHKIVFESNRRGNGDIYVMNADGTGQANLTINGADDGEPVWSPDGRKIAFTSDRDGNSEVYVMNADGSGQTRLTNNPALDSGPVWSPDGEKIVFVSDRDGNNEIYVMNADGSGQTNLSNNEASEGDPLWSPDGTKVAFSSDRDMPYVPGIYLMNADGSGQTLLYHGGDRHSWPAEWSPGGSRLLFERDSEGTMQIGVMNADGSGRRIFSFEPYWYDNFAPSWSPDGTKIVFVGERDGDYYDNCEICVINADGTGETRLTRNSAADTWPSWRYR
jgi:Tol biopolymer transport system component